MQAGSGRGDAATPDERTGPAGDRHPAPPAAVAARLPLSWREVDVGALRVGLFAPADPDALLDALTQEEFDRSDQRMPYWALLWPSAKALAALVAEGDPLEGRRVLDLGCGVGLCGLAALRRGASVTFLDWEADAVTLALASADAAGLPRREGVVADWRSPPPMRPFDLVLAADVLYEERNAPGVAAFLASHVAEAGEAWVVDPGRRHAAGLEDAVRGAGLEIRSRDALPARDDATDLVRYRLGHARKASCA
jgi:predicted nicotinamide N-methyase